MTRSVEQNTSNSGGTGLEQSPFGCGDGRGDSELTPGGVGDRRVSHNPIRSHTEIASRTRTLTITHDSLCMVAANGWEIMYARVTTDKREIDAAIRHARNSGARIVDERPLSDEKDVAPVVDEPQHGHAMLPNEQHPSPHCSCRECLARWP